MVESNIGKQEAFKSSELLVSPPISANTLLKRVVNESSELSLRKKKIHFYKLQADDATEYIGVVESDLGGLALNHLLLSLAPFKGFDLDTWDILNDWKQIDHNPERKTRHEQMGKPWFIFDKDRLYFRQLIEKDYNDGMWTADKKQRGLIPVIRWRTLPENKRELVFDPLDPTQNKKLLDIVKTHVPNYEDGMDIRFLSSTIGYFVVCHFSPEIKNNTEIWRTIDTYSPNSQASQYQYIGQSIGPTQVGAYAIKLEDTMINASFYNLAEKYIESTAQPLK